jgi:hypothetical protein
MRGSARCRVEEGKRGRERALEVVVGSAGQRTLSGTGGRQRGAA